MPDSHAHHPAIRRGHFEFQTFVMGEAHRPDPNGDVTIRTIGSVPLLLRVVLAGPDLPSYLPDMTDEERPREMTPDAFVQLVAPYLREGLIDTWAGRGSGRTPPVMTMEREDGLAFVQPVGCLN